MKSSLNYSCLFSCRILFLFLFFILTFFSSQVKAQNDHLGYEFYFGFPEHEDSLFYKRGDARFRVSPRIYINASETANGIINYFDQTVEFSLNQGETFIYDFPSSIDIQSRKSYEIEDKGVSISATGKVSVYAFSERRNSSDGTIILPLDVLSNEYRVITHFEPDNRNPADSLLKWNFESSFLVVATEDDTEIEVIPSINNMKVVREVLNKGELFQVKANGDLTGSLVRVVNKAGDSCKKIAVFGGNKMTGVTSCGVHGDHLFQQMYPIYTWGKEYVHIPISGRDAGEMVKILANETNTMVYINDIFQFRLNAGQHRSITHKSSDPLFISASAPVSVASFQLAASCESTIGNRVGDPSIVSLSPLNQMLNEISFPVYDLDGAPIRYLNILAHTGTETYLDGISISEAFRPIAQRPEYMYATIPVTLGTHILKNSEGLNAYAYASSFFKSYSYAIGASLKNLNFETKVDYGFEVFGDQVACLNKEGVWLINSRLSKFNYFEWDFGDGTEILSGEEVSYTFGKPGKYTIKVMAMIEPNSCDEMEEAFFDVEVLETFGEIEGPESVCPEIDEATYVFENPINVQKVLWDVEGGEILQADDFSVRIRWGEFNPEAKVFAIPVTDQGCLASVKAYEVLVNEFIEPGLAKGISQICFEEGLTYRYEVKDRIPNRSYAWFIEGGILLSDPTSPEVEVDWGPVGTVGEIWYEEFSEINSSCLGESKKLQVTVNPPLRAEVAELTAFICPGAAEGFIRVNVTGGSGQYHFVWSHDPELDAPLADGLLPGIYEVKVLDAGGCELFLEQLEIKESEPMELEGTPAIIDALCFDSEDGYVSFNIKGGVPPYRVDTESALVMGGSIQVFDLARGDYVLKVFDAAKCMIEVEVSIGSPDALAMSYEIERVACPGIASGELSVLPEGGIGPYSITWEWDGSEGSSLMDIPAGTYAFTLTDANGCSQNFTAEMKEGFPQLRMPTGFVPSDGLFMGVSNCSIEFKLMVYNKWGQLLFAGNSGWDGLIEGEMAPTGTYSYMIEYYFVIDGVGKSRQQRGVFTLIR